MFNVQKDLRKRLDDAFPEMSVRTSTPKLPEHVPKKLITVQREGGRKRNALVDGPGIGIYCYAETEYEASEMAIAVDEFMQSLSFPDGYADVSQEQMRTDQDELTGSPRWYISYTLKTYEPREA